MKYAFLFPGQGSQSVGMGKDLADTFSCARGRFARADEVLQRPLTSLMWNGPMEELTLTRNTQPALFTVEAAIADVLAEKGIRPAVVAGHSLGEYSALYAAGVLAFDEGIRLVAQRGELMAVAGAKTPGAMAAVIGLEKGKIIEVLKTVVAGIVVTANENSPDQTVISGETAAVAEAGEKLKAAGAKKVVPLPVSGAFHSPLMQSAADELVKLLQPVAFGAPRCPVVANVTARPENDAQILKGLLVKQLVSPVRWVESMQAVAASGCDAAVEAGPGSVLRGLARKCSPEMNTVAAGSVAEISAVAA